MLRKKRFEIKSVGIIDYGSGNFRSVWLAFSRTGVSLGRVTSESQLAQHSHLVLPGVGSFGGAMKRLDSMNLTDPIRQTVSEGDRPFLGICVGMQLLFEVGFEFEQTEGLGIFSGSVDSLNTKQTNGSLVLPHIGWNTVNPGDESQLFRGMDGDELSFYFLHSFVASSNEADMVRSTTLYGEEFLSSVERGQTFGVQFHPEKSQINGRALLENFIAIS